MATYSPFYFQGNQIGVADIEAKLYTLRSVQKAYATANLGETCVHVWHRILGHRDQAVVKTLASGCLVNGCEIGECDVDEKCEICLKGKMTRLPFPKKSQHESKKVLDLVHSDLCGPMQTQTPSGKRYMSSFIDDFSRFTVARYMCFKIKNMSEKYKI